MDETPLIQQYLQLRSEFMGYLYAMTRDAELAEEIYQNAAVVVIKKADQPEVIRNFRAWAKEVVRRQADAIRALGVSAVARPLVSLLRARARWRGPTFASQRPSLVTNRLFSSNSQSLQSLIPTNH